MDCATEDVKLHVCVVTEEGKLWQTVHFEDLMTGCSSMMSPQLSEAPCFLQFICANRSDSPPPCMGQLSPAVRQQMSTNCYRIRRKIVTVALYVPIIKPACTQSACGMPCEQPSSGGTGKTIVGTALLRRCSACMVCDFGGDRVFPAFSSVSTRLRLLIRSLTELDGSHRCRAHSGVAL